MKKNFDYCPFCGNSFREFGRDNFDSEKLERDFGMLGRNDRIDFPNNFSGSGIKLPFGFNRLLGSLMKELDKQMKELDREIGKEKTEIKEKKFYKGMPVQASGISISVNVSGDNKPVIKVKKFGDANIKEINLNEIKGLPFGKEILQQIGEGEGRSREVGEKIEKPKTQIKISDKKLKEIAKLPRKEAKTNVRRLSNKIIYEVDLPGVNDIKNVIINKLENSIEIKAISKNNVFVKLIPVDLPLLNYSLKDGKLVLELRAEG